MRKLFILCAACLMCIGAMAETETINAVSVTQGTTTDWYRLGNPKKVHVDIAGTSVTFPNKTYNATDDKISTAFGTAPEVITETTWWGTGSDQGVSVLYSITRNLNKTLTFHVDTWGDVPNLQKPQIGFDGVGISDMDADGNWTSTATYETDEVVNLFFYIPFTGADAHIDVAYTVGSENVKPAIEVTGVSIDPASAAVEVGKTTSLTAIIKPAFATNTNISWSVIAGSEYASVNANGVVTGKAAGAAKVQVTTESGSKTATCDVNVVAQILLEPNAAPAAPTVPANQVKAVYSETYNADCDFGDWGSGTAYTQDTYGKKYVNGAGGYFGMVDFALNCSQMEKLHLDVWAVTDITFSVVPIHGGAEKGVTVNIEGQKWNSIDLSLSEGAYAEVTDWSNVYQIKIDQAANTTFWLNNVYFYTTQTKTTCALSAADFTVTKDGDWTYDKTEKRVNVELNPEYIMPSADKITIYYNNDKTLKQPINPGTYQVYIDIEETDIYAAVTGITSEDWKFDITDPLPAIKEDAINEVGQVAATAKAEIDGLGVDESAKSDAKADIDNIAHTAEQTINAATSKDAIDNAKTQAIADIHNVVQTTKDMWVTVRTDGVAGNWNTICLERNITTINGATFWTISGQDANSFILDEVTEPQAGQGYLIRFTAADLKVKYGDQVATEPVTATYDNPIQGTYTQIDFDEQGKNVLVGNYVVYQNQLCPVEAWVGLLANRAYVKADYVPDNAPAPAPGRARAYMPKPKETPTGFGTVEQGQRTGKFLHKGQLIIVKGNKMYNAQGMKL